MYAIGLSDWPKRFDSKRLAQLSIRDRVLREFSLLLSERRVTCNLPSCQSMYFFQPLKYKFVGSGYWSGSRTTIRESDFRGSATGFGF